MGHIKTEELSNGNIGLEVTYGGIEAPFGGVDSSAPPAYIDPRCFTQCDGFIVVDNKLVAASLVPVQIPVLWNGIVGVTLIGFGNFYNPKYGTLNYALGYTAVAVAGSPTGVAYTFYMTSWIPGNPATFYNDTLNYTLFNSLTPDTAASISLQLQTTSSATPGTGATVTITGVTTLTGATSGSPSNTAFSLPGIITALTVTGGINYSVGSTYWIQQGTNVTAQIIVTAVGGGGNIIGFTLVPDSFTANYVNVSYLPVSVGVAGWNYAVGAAALVYTQNSDVILNINGPSGTATYTVESNGITPTTPTLAGVTLCQVIEVAAGGVRHNFTDDTLSIGPLISCFGGGGAGFNVGELYELIGQVSGYTGANAQVLITEVGPGGSVVSFELISAGDANTGYLCRPLSFMALSAAPVPTLTTGPAFILNTMASDIKGTGTYPPDANVTAEVDSGHSALVLTAIIPGAIGNSITVQDRSTITGPDLFYYFFPFHEPLFGNLTGGSDGAGSGTVLSTLLPTQASITAVGGTLYIGNIGPAIIKYGGPGAFVVSTTYQGVRVLRKFTGSLIGLGLIPAPGTVIQSTDMIFAWTTAGKLDNWNPLDLTGNITGAGFEQLADIADYLSGLIVTSGTAFIIRSEGISYATPTGNATLPFAIAHIGLGDEGEGAQISSLVCQYDQTGAYVGNSDVYQISSSISSIGAKIKALLFQAIASGNSFKLLSANTCSVYIGGDTFVLVNFLAPAVVPSQGIGLQRVTNVNIFAYNTSNASWVTFTYPVIIPNTLVRPVLATEFLGVFASSNTSAGANKYNQSLSVVGIQLEASSFLSSTTAPPQFFALQEGLTNINAISQASSVTFAQEELAFGRDITIDALYVSLVGDFSEDVQVTFSFSGVVFAVVTLSATQFNTLNSNPIELQIFPTTVNSSGAFTVHAPQLQIVVSGLPDNGTAQLRVIKVAWFGSFDPAQRPV